MQELLFYGAHLKCLLHGVYLEGCNNEGLSLEWRTRLCLTGLQRTHLTLLYHEQEGNRYPTMYHEVEVRISEPVLLCEAALSWVEEWRVWPLRR